MEPVKFTFECALWYLTFSHFQNKELITRSPFIESSILFLFVLNALLHVYTCINQDRLGRGIVTHKP